MFMSLQAQNQQNLLPSFPPHHHIIEGIPPHTTATNTFLHPAAAWLFGLPPPPQLNNSLPPHCSHTSPKSPSQLINNVCSATSLQQNLLSSMCHPQSSQSLADEDDDWEQMMEISCTDEAEKIRESAGDNAQPPTDPNQCIICRRVLSCKSALQMHYRTHTGERPFKCRICQRAFTTKGNLKTHMGVHKSKAPLRQHIFALGSNSDSPERCHSSNENLINSDIFSGQQQRFSMEEGSQPLNNLNRSFPFPPSILFSSSSSASTGRNNLVYGSSLPPHSNIGSLPQSFPPNFPPTTFMSNFSPINGIPPPFPLSMAADSSQAALAAQLQLFLSSNHPQLNENNSSVDHGLALSNLFLPPKDGQKMEVENGRIKNEEKNEMEGEEGKEKNEEMTSSFNVSSPNRKISDENSNNNEDNNNNNTFGLPAFFIQKLAAAAKFKIEEQFLSSSSNVKTSFKEDDNREEEEDGKTKKKKKRINNDEIEELEMKKFSKKEEGEEKRKDGEEDEEDKGRIESSTSPSMLESVPQTSFSSSIKIKEEIKKEKEENPLENLQRIFSAADSPPPQPPSSSSAMPPSAACFLLAPIQKPPNAKHHCRWCMKGFSSSSALQIHTRTHTGILLLIIKNPKKIFLGDRPYKCEICERAFTTRGNLKVHKGTHSLPQNPSRRGRRIFDMEDTILGTIRQQQPHLFPQSPPLPSNFDEQQQRQQQQAAAAIANLLANVVGNNNSFGILNETATNSNTSIPALINSSANASVSETPSASNQLLSTTTSPLLSTTNTSNFAAAAAAQLAALGSNDGQQLLMGLLFQHLQNVEMSERIEVEREEGEGEEEENGREENGREGELKEREEEEDSVNKTTEPLPSVIKLNNNERIEEYLKENIKKKNHSSENNIIVPVHNTAIL
ncbi:unnamed protein product [Meloidogyne enterolobii]|uniref:Uncharacterized protein n=1 Tax=Meloidogyne enterolobii TaxID=390850 RepID=A0ACB0YL01_MELEN